MNDLYLRLIWLCVFASWCSAGNSPSHGNFGTSHLHKRGESDLDFVQCHHNVYRINPENGKPEAFRGQESRVDPSRQYLPPPGPVQPSPPPNDIEAPAASFEQPKFLSVENTFVSPAIQNNYKSLFGDDDKKDLLSPAAAQNPLSNALAPSTARKTNDKKHSHHDDEDNLERLCNDAFHSFLCKPIKGPRKTPTGRLRPNAVIPPDVLSGLASFQDISRVQPDKPQAPKRTAKPTTQRVPLPKQFLTTRYVPTSPPFTKRYEPSIPEIPSPSSNFPQIVKPQPSNEVPLKASAQTTGYSYDKPSVPFTPQISNPSNQNSQFITQRPTYQTPSFRPTTARPTPTSGYSYDKPNVPFPSNTIQKFAQPPQHDCEKQKHPTPSIIPKSSNENPSYIRPIIASTPKPFVKSYFEKSGVSTFGNNLPIRTFAPEVKSSVTPPVHDCTKHRVPFTPPSTDNPKLPLPSNNIAQIVAQHPPPTAKPFVYQKPIFPSPSNQLIRTPPPPPQVKIPTQHLARDCESHNPFTPSATENPKLSLPSNNIAQIIAQPQQVNTVRISPQKPSGYFYEKPAVPFPTPAKPTTQRPTPPPFSFQTTTQKPNEGYVYDQPRIPFPSNNIAQIISQSTPTPSTIAPCEHEKSQAPIINKPANQNYIVLKPAPASNSYVYDKPKVPFPPDVPGPTNQNSISVRPSQNPITGYNYGKPATPFLLPSSANNSPKVIASPANNGYSYQKPDKPFPPQTNLPSNNNQFVANRPSPSTTSKPSQTSKPFTGYSYDAPKIPFPTNINSRTIRPFNNNPTYEAKPQTQVEVAVRPGYTYDKPSNPFVSPQSTGTQGYSYPKPASPFIR